MSASENVSEFLRQWKSGSGNGNEIHGVNTDPEAGMAVLTVADLETVLEQRGELLEALENLARTVTVIPGLRSTPEAITARAILDKATGIET